jgi:hypothetical protein
MTIPATEAELVVPVPPAADRFLTMFPVIVAAGALFRMPFTMVPVAVLVLWTELAMFPPTVLLLQLHVTPEPVKQRIPYTFEAPVLLLLAEIPPTLLLSVVQALDPILYIPITSLADVLLLV